MLDIEKEDIPSGTSKKDYLASLKSIETENKIDRVFYRKVGYKIAVALVPTGVSPNTVTIISILIGVLCGPMIYFSSENYIWGLFGIAFLVIANILDCVDGQLSRLTGKKSNIGRILDGIAGDLWFFSIYVGISMRLVAEHHTSIFYIFAALSLVSHLSQAALTDYYKTLHLLFISPEKGAEFDDIESINRKYNDMEPGLNKLFFWFYKYYTTAQMTATPKLQKMVETVRRKFKGFRLPEEESLRFRKGSMIVMKLIDLLTFNGRSIVLFIAILLQQLWIYLAYEIVALNIVLFTSRLQHETLCEFYTEYIENKYKNERD
ncbi:CDP-alcohol phosphatidyltransferase family protein [Porphyromonas sp. COT-108 OH2963]|uniref:CDP-alcohol phosphatidyltransferase family protein n=1 Tax=Porphyromonas sp. COT-108 OH2963 TaxID=1515614 RepID=UPI00068CDD46|nr:CDP-alcohol phosphatidyltransferase family protein [Porphyromonas sp. COT-108 OH2963]